MQKIVLIFIFLFVIIFSVQSQTWEQVYQQADSLMQAREFAASMPIYEQALSLAEEEFGKNSEPYLQTRNNLGRSMTYAKEKDSTEVFLLQNVKLCKAFGESTPLYATALHNAGTFYHPSIKGNQPELSQYYLEEALALRKEVLGEKHYDYASSLNNLAALYWNMGKYAEAEPLYKESLQIKKETLGEKHHIYASSLNNLALLYRNMGKYTEAEPLYRESLQIKKEILGEKHPEYASSLNNLGLLYQDMGNYAQAEPLYKENLKIKKETLGEKHPEYASSLNSLAILYWSMGKYAQAERLYRESLQIRKENLGEEHPEYASSLNNLAALYVDMGNYEKAEPLYKESLQIKKETLGEKHPDYASSLNNLAILYKEMGSYAQAELLYKESLQIRKETLGKKHPDYAKSLNNLAILYVAMGNYNQSEPLYKESLQIRKEILGEKHPEYAVSLNNLAILYWNMGNYKKAEQLHKESLQINKEALGEKHPSYAMSLNNLGTLYKDIGNYDQSEPLYKESLQIRKEILGEKHPDYATSLYNLGLLYQKKGAFEQALPFYRQAKANKNQQIKNLLPTLSEKERIAYLNSIQAYFNGFQVFTIAHHKEKPSIIAELYDQTLFTKGIVFSSTQKMRQQILNSEDSLLIADFDRWKLQKNTYNKLMEKGQTEIQKTGINLDSMAAQINELEKVLSKRSALFAENVQVKSYKWQQVREKLDKNEAVVEIIRTLKTVGHDSLGKSIKDIVYIAFFVTPKTKKQPEMLILENGNELENKYFNYYKRTIEFKIEDENSYNQYWKPIEDKLKQLHKKGFDKIYFSPDGVYHQISLNSLRNPKTDKFLLEYQNIQLIGTSRDLIELGTSNKVDLSQNFENYRTFLLGYPTYNLEGQDKEAIESEEHSFSSLQRIIGQRGAVAVLPGTKAEIEVIKTYFNKKNIKTQILLETDANEENFKKIASPTILHVATHGFFVPQIEKTEVKTVQEAINRKILDNPFMRSGLLLAGCETPKPEGEDGILTAEEAMNLSLENTELVVLSACETGLGDIQNGEGVFGLQRAFQQAGAKTVLMSLWKVSDEATQLLMSEFYKNLLSGKSKREAFKDAQFSLKAKYPEPYFWGAFVMVGE
ncbi:MAG: CHAT domain-containing protein [Bernardetiaceae bacterium]|nr:CHAT domain-containing protein [Bernardetiaceae bacterium]